MSNPTKFRALIVRKSKERKFSYGVENTDTNFLPDNDVTIRVHYSSLNFKDCLSCQGNLGVTRRFPHIPGIDAAGIVMESKDLEWKPGDRVIVLSHDLGMNTCGGFGQIIKVPGSWIIRLPDGMSLFESMALGTAGYTASLAVSAIENSGIVSSSDQIVVTGATGGVGSLSVYLSSLAGYDVTAITGKETAGKFLIDLGAKDIVSRDEFINQTDRNLLPENYMAGIDVAGGATLTTLIRSTKSGGLVISTGMADSTEISLTVLPFILRGVSLVGVNADLNDARRMEVWNRLAEIIPKPDYSLWSESIILEELPSAIRNLINGTNIGRIVVDMKPREDL